MADQPPRSKPPAAPAAPVPSAGQLDVTQPPPQQSTALDATGAFDPPPATTDALLGTRPAAAGKTTGGELPANDATQGARGLDQTQDSTADSSPMESAGGADADEDSLRTSLRDFRLIKKLGEGGMGKVFKAQQISLDRVVAVKVPFKHLAKDPSFVQRFYREARIMARLDHPHILRCFGVGEENGWHYLAMEFIDGASMQNWLEKLGKLSIGDALHVAIATAHGLQHAHEQDMVHRDIKPDNILVTGKGVVKVADMGLAKALTDDLSLSRTGTGAGTPHYMAPEQARDAKHVDNRCDIYALGCMLYCFLGGKPPFSAETYMELILAKEKGKYPPVRRLNPAVPERLELMIDKAIATKPEVRYKTCADFVKDLESLNLANEVLSFIPGATPPTRVTVGGGTTKPPAMAPQKTVPAQSKTAPPGKTAATTPTKTGAPGADPRGTWYVKYAADSGKLVKRKMSAPQVLELIKSPEFDLETQACRTLKGVYRPISQIKEFDNAFQARVAKVKADKKASQFHNAYEKILGEEKSFYRKRKAKNFFRSVGGVITLIIFLAVIAGMIYGGYLLLPRFMGSH
jgi:eukaryotic-like serine/threonine-protein kinase